MVERDKRVHPTWRKIQEIRGRLRDFVVSTDRPDDELVALLKEAIKVLDQGVAYELDLFAWEDADEGHFKNIDQFEELKKRLEDRLLRKQRMAIPPPPLTPAQMARIKTKSGRMWVARGKMKPPPSSHHVKVKRTPLSP